MDWEWIISVLIIGGLILAIWAKVSQQTIVELLRDIKEMLQDKQEEAVEVYV